MSADLATDLGKSADKPENIVSALDLELEVGRLRRAIEQWVESCNTEVRAPLRWQFSGPAKYFRPLTVLSCFRAAHKEQFGDEQRLFAMVIELIHNMTLIVDDILDKSRYRRQKLTLHCRFGMLPALMTAGFIVSEAYRILQLKPRAIELLSSLMSRLAIAECLQWRVRSQPLGIEDWRQIASEDTGSMFEICACLGGGDERLRRFGQLLGLLYHGCDDVADVKGLEALGGGGDDDIRDGILTLPASIAIRDPHVSALFRNPTKQTHERLSAALQSAIPEAERWLDRIAAEARREANENAKHPEGLITLVDYTRGLSSR